MATALDGMHAAQLRNALDLLARQMASARL